MNNTKNFEEFRIVVLVSIDIYCARIELVEFTDEGTRGWERINFHVYFCALHQMSYSSPNFRSDHSVHRAL